MLDKNVIVPCIDWFRGIVPVQNVYNFVKELEKIDNRLAFENFVCDGRSKLNFKNCWRHIEVPSLSFSFNPTEESLSCLMASDTHNNKGILFELTGDAIRYLGSDVLKHILTYIHSLGTKCTRIDYALDFFDKDNEIVPLMQEGCKNFMNPIPNEVTVSGKIKRSPTNIMIYLNCYPRIDKKKFEALNLPIPVIEESINYNLGNHGSDHGMFRLYDKQYETLYGRNKSRASELMKGNGYWYRAELELHNGTDVPWANDSFHNLVVNDFQLYSVIGHTFDMWFAFKIRDFKSSKHSSCVVWDEFISELIATIHFVQLVHSKYVNRDTEYYWNQIIHNSTWLSLLLDISDLDPVRWSEILNAGRVRRQSETKYKLKYGSVEVAASLGVRL